MHTTHYQCTVYPYGKKIEFPFVIPEIYYIVFPTKNRCTEFLLKGIEKQSQRL